jgi:hypothetical protein
MLPIPPSYVLHLDEERRRRLFYGHSERQRASALGKMSPLSPSFYAFRPGWLSPRASRYRSDGARHRVLIIARQFLQRISLGLEDD